MRRPASVPLPDASRRRTASTVRSYRPEDAEEVVRVNAAAFARHPEQGAMDLDGLRERMAEDWFDPAGLLVADSGDGLLRVPLDEATQPRARARCTSSASTPPPRAVASAGSSPPPGLAHLASAGCPR